MLGAGFSTTIDQKTERIRLKARQNMVAKSHHFGECKKENSPFEIATAVVRLYRIDLSKI